MVEEALVRVRTPFFPLYSEVRALLKIWPGFTKEAVLTLINALQDQRGTPQNPVDWTEPDTWIKERLSDENEALAERIWQSSGKQVNPRYVYGSYLFINSYDLLVTDVHGIYHLTQSGEGFLNNEESIVRAIDEIEGLPQLLSILAPKSPVKRSDLLDEWGQYLKERSRVGTASAIKEALWRRLRNLVERGLIARNGNSYAITDEGLKYAATTATEQEDPKAATLRAIKDFNAQQTQQLRDQLSRMGSYQFEKLVRDLLEAMDYEDVVVTKQSGDKGVDVVAKYQYGITEITEVVQVKRQQASLNRPVLDQLRGALPYHGAIRGSIITLGKFAKGCKDAAIYPGAAPITLIDGDKLIELLVKHEIGLVKRRVDLIEVDMTFFNERREIGVEASEENELTVDPSALID
ncbi:MAG: restriction endonuclease [Rhodospirillales bacterium]|nr:restriction endonuclease [Rhodospirillales bacterium]